MAGNDNGKALLALVAMVLGIAVFTTMITGDILHWIWVPPAALFLKRSAGR